MYKCVLECNRVIDFYDIGHYLRWISLYGGCQRGCRDKICKQREVNINGMIVKFNEVYIKGGWG